MWVVGLFGLIVRVQSQTVDGNGKKGGGRRILMSEIAYIGGALLAILVIYQIYVSVIIFRADEYEQVQRLLQFSLVWIVPLFGAVGCHLVLRSQREAIHREDNFFVPQASNDAGDADDDGHYGDGH